MVMVLEMGKQPRGGALYCLQRGTLPGAFFSPSLLALIALGFAVCTAHSRRFPLNFQKVWCLKQICKKR